MDDGDRLERIERLLLAIAALLASGSEGEDGKADTRRTEVLLSNVGLGLQEIATILGRSPEAVRSTIRRSQKATGPR